MKCSISEGGSAAWLCGKPRLSATVMFEEATPVRDGWVERADEYRWFSFRCWQQRPRDDELLFADLEQTRWRKS